MHADRFTVGYRGQGGKVKEELISVPSAEAPRFINVMSDVKVSQGHQAVLEVMVAGDPSISISWLKDNCIITPSHEYQMSQLPNGIAKLVIPNAQPHHVATYTAKAANSVGEAKQLASLLVRPPTPPPPVVEILEPPIFVQTFGDASLKAGESLTLKCVVK